MKKSPSTPSAWIIRDGTSENVTCKDVKSPGRRWKGRCEDHRDVWSLGERAMGWLKAVLVWSQGRVLYLTVHLYGQASILSCQALAISTDSLKSSYLLPGTHHMVWSILLTPKLWPQSLHSLLAC